MIRFVVGPDRQIVPDLAARLPGRGIWLSASWDVLESESVARIGRTGREEGGQGSPRKPQAGRARETNSRLPVNNRGASDKALVRAFARAARGPVSVPSDLLGLASERRWIRRISELSWPGPTRRTSSGGFEKARELLRTGRSGTGLVQASDGSEAERARFLLLPASGQASRMPIIDPLPGEDLGRVFGRDYVVHVAVAPGKVGRVARDGSGQAGRVDERVRRALGSEGATGREPLR